MQTYHIGVELVWVRFLPNGRKWHRLHPEQPAKTACCGRDVNLWEVELGMEGADIPNEDQCKEADNTLRTAPEKT